MALQFNYVLLISRSRSPDRQKRGLRCATDARPSKLLVRQCLTALPDEKLLAAELESTRQQLETRR